MEAAFTAALPEDERVLVRGTFGWPAALVNGNLFAGLFRGAVYVRLPEEERPPGAAPLELVPGTPMQDLVVLPEDEALDPERLRAWLRRAFEHAASLPPTDQRVAPDRG